ncbi:uncharacterized protein Eint_010180 [Encephalitozoon intestinalis ATCC 50506]|uniref:Uncharacterized protein n=1 Tax=Encephalitozoon intestinalis (strain ATCC 50506) TaxID=876142 RepID=E0S597_ENCIT|nr:uncharacterized protein Eint_010180 [Encephalitozoon intestinalis ATCC 50506]ADM10882.1 hypothetical protein Eint_010180 [Encephalitozoon intestinalis ATCC 50506]UTX44514.1 hypothetical protein GPK93_01g00220 [Encephalitozoon intestinalis]
MEVLREELEKISSKYDSQELYVEGFTPEQIYYQIEELCNTIIQRCEDSIARLDLKCEKPIPQNDREICHEESSGDEERKGFFKEDNIPPEPSGSNEDGDDENTTEDEGESMESKDFDAFADKISQMPASEAIKLLESRVKNNSEWYSSEEELSDEDGE